MVEKTYIDYPRTEFKENPDVDFSIFLGLFRQNKLKCPFKSLPDKVILNDQCKELFINMRQIVANNKKESSCILRTTGFDLKSLTVGTSVSSATKFKGDNLLGIFHSHTTEEHPIHEGDIAPLIFKGYSTLFADDLSKKKVDLLDKLVASKHIDKYIIAGLVNPRHTYMLVKTKETPEYRPKTRDEYENFKKVYYDFYMKFRNREDWYNRNDIDFMVTQIAQEYELAFYYQNLQHGDDQLSRIV